MKKLLFLLICFSLLVFVSGCDLPFMPGGDDFPAESVETFEINGHVLEKLDNNNLVISTSVVTDVINVPQVEWAGLDVGDSITVMASLDEIFGMIVAEPIDSEFSISSRGFDYESRGYVSDKFEEENLYYIMVAGNKVSGEIVVSADKYNEMDVNEEVRVFSDLNGIHSIVSIAE